MTAKASKDQGRAAATTQAKPQPQLSPQTAHRDGNRGVACVARGARPLRLTHTAPVVDGTDNVIQDADRVADYGCHKGDCSRVSITAAGTRGTPSGKWITGTSFRRGFLRKLHVPHLGLPAVHKLHAANPQLRLVAGVPSDHDHPVNKLGLLSFTAPVQYWPLPPVSTKAV